MENKKKEDYVKVPVWIIIIFRIATGLVVIVCSMGLSRIIDWIIKTAGESSTSEVIIGMFVIFTLAYILGIIMNKLTRLED